MTSDFPSIVLPPPGVVLRLPPNVSTVIPSVTGEYVYQQVRRQLKDGLSAVESTMSVQMKSQLQILHDQQTGVCSSD